MGNILSLFFPSTPAVEQQAAGNLTVSLNLYFYLGKVAIHSIVNCQLFILGGNHSVLSMMV